MPNEFKGRLHSLPTGPIPSVSPRPQAGQIPPKLRWRFSLRFWRQLEHFGLGQCQKGWFVSLLDRLRELSDLNIEETTSGALATAIRYHPINWDSRSIPLKKDDIDWLGNYSSPEFELVQFHVSKALGRVIGFFDEDTVFNIVLIDPLHNIQPSKTYGYRVRASHLADCDLTRMSVAFERALQSCGYISAAQKMELLIPTPAESDSRWGFPKP